MGNGERGTGNGEQPAGVLGVILAGGASRRFGAPKALATVGGRRIVERVRDALAESAVEVVMVANDAAVFASVGVAARADVVRGAGPLAGIVTALRWADELGYDGALCVACDMPFVPGALLRRIADGAWRGGAVVPESGGRRGVEPLCAWYGADCLPVAERMLADGSRALHSLLELVPARRIPRAEVRRFGDPELLFLNVNTPADHERAERIAAESA